MHILYSVQTRTHPGKVRENNEDALGTVLDWREALELSDEILQQRGHLFAVADGMGGHAAGEVASNLAISTLFTEYYTGEWIDPKTTLAAAIKAANRAVFEMAEANAAMSGMGTTLVAALYQPQQGLIVNIGDSRAYLFRSGKITQMTKDHSWVAEQVNSGILTEKEAAHHPFRNVITRSLGNEAHVEPDFFQLPPQPGDTLLLCSDGLSNQVADKEISDILRAYPLDEAADRLLELALERGAPDNVTLILIQAQGGIQRRSKSFLPWLALVAAVIILGGFVFWSLRRNSPPPAMVTATPALAIATYTPVVTPNADALSPTPTSKIVKTPVSESYSAAATLPGPAESFQDITDIGTKDAVVLSSLQPADADSLYYISGNAVIESVAEDESVDELVITSGAGTGDAISYAATLEKNKYVATPPPTGGQLALIGYLQKDQGEKVLQPLLLLAPFSAGNQFIVLWEKDDGAIQTFLDQFGLKGQTLKKLDATILQLQ